MSDHEPPYTTPIKVHYRNPQSPEENNYEDGDYEENVEKAEDEAWESFERAKEMTQELVAELDVVTDVELTEDESYPGWPASSLDFIPIVFDVTHDVPTEEVKSLVEESLGEQDEYEVIDVYVVQPELP